MTLILIFKIKVHKITQTVKLNNVPSDVVKLLLFSFSLEGAARTWLEKEPPNSITTWNDLVSKFVNRFFPPSKTTNLRNEITRFQQRFGETFAESWDRFKDLLNKCPHHGFSPLHQIDTFSNSLNQSEQDSLNSAACGNFLTKNTQEALTIIENKFKVQTSRNKPQVASANGRLGLNKRRAFWSLNEDIFKIIVSEDQYTVSIKEDMAYPCLHSPKPTKGIKINTPYPEDSIRRIQDKESIENSEDIKCGSATLRTFPIAALGGSNNTTSDSFFIPNLKTHEKSDTKKEEEQSQTKRKYNNTSSTTDEALLTQRRCKQRNSFKAIQYSLGPNEEYIAIRSYEYDIWEKETRLFVIIYPTMFLRKDEGWKVTRAKDKKEAEEKSNLKTSL
ncbi:reverse transcriptase domain-containing protein [Tanacetum coccineum]